MKKIIKVILILGVLYLAFVFSVKIMIDTGITNADSQEISIITGGMDKIPAEMRQVHKYISEHPKDAYKILEAYLYLNGTGGNTKRFPQNNGGLDFVIKGINTRKYFVEGVNDYSKKLGIDPDLVMACVLSEQIRIANKGARGSLKDIIVGSTPTLFISYNTSLGIGGIKVSTARQIAEDAKKYGYDDGLDHDYYFGDKSMGNQLSKDTYFNAKYAAFLVKNIITRRALSGYDISTNPGIVCTLYNMGNDIKEVPNNNPKIGGSVIQIGKQKYVYGGISMGVYWFLKIYK